MGEFGVSSERDCMDVVFEEEEAEKELKKEGLFGWESFLPRMFLRVLLVEADDSTRQIIAALLRKCNYKVAAVADGLRAWETLKEKPHSIDLILSEVELPSISGFGLLTMIMGHENCKNIPVIMMSSHDSVSVVFKCMLRGATDFLVKPIRKNELRNLWQHVWRRHSSNGGRHVGKDGKLSQQKFDAVSENNAASNHSSDYVASTQQNRDCSEKGSDAQSSCTKPDMEVESACIHDMQDLLQPQCGKSTLATDPKGQRNLNLVNLDGALLMQESFAEDKSRRLESEVTPCNQAYGSNKIMLDEKRACARVMTRDEDVAAASYREDLKEAEPPRNAIDLIGAIDNQPKFYNLGDQTSVRCDLPNDTEDLSNAKDGMCGLNSAPLLELSLRRSQQPNVYENQEVEERHILNHSNASAFSQYNNRTVQPKFLSSTSFGTEHGECTSGHHQSLSRQAPANNSSHCDRVTENNQQESNSPTVGPPGQDKTGLQSSQFRIVPVSVPAPIGGMPFEGLRDGYGALVQPVFYPQPGPPPWNANTTNQQEAVHASSSHQSDPKIQNSDQNLHPCDQIANKPISQYVPLREQSLEPKEDLKHFPSATGQSGSSSLCNGSRSHLNSSGCGSVCNGSNRNVTAAAASGVTAESGNNEGLIVHDGIKAMDYQRFCQREAALTKFRLKRKDRCYEKKVRYQSRKRLAEQRPRVKGQFVRQM